MDVDAQQANAQLCASMEKCLHYLRSLKGIVLNAHNTLTGKLTVHDEATARDMETDQQNFEKVRETVERFAQQMSTGYEKLEAEAKALPSQTPPFLMVNKLNFFLLDCATNPQQMKDTYANTRDVFEWSESSASYVNYAYEFIKLTNISAVVQQRQRKLIMANQWNIQNELTPFPSNQPHIKFMDHIIEVLKQSSKRMPEFEYKIAYNFLERSVLSSIIEVKYFLMSKTRSSDGQMVCLQKFAMLVNNGIIEYVHFVAPHENWHYDEIPGIGNKKQVNLSIPSLYELYQKSTIFGNIVLSSLHNTAPNVKVLLFILFQQLARISIIDQVCAKCRKKLRDFTPVIDHSAKMPIHMGCRFF